MAPLEERPEPREETDEPLLALWVVGLLAVAVLATAVAAVWR